MGEEEVNFLTLWKIPKEILDEQWEYQMSHMRISNENIKFRIPIAILQLEVH